MWLLIGLFEGKIIVMHGDVTYDYVPQLCRFFLAFGKES
jgi:hypothetical protein